MATMSPFVRSGRTRAKALGLSLGLTASVGLVALAPGLTGPANALPEGCDQAFPVAELADGQAVSGTTVDNGTTPEDFTGEVLGVLEDGIAPGLDMIMAELHSPAIDKAGGIWQGMSGSPVFAEDGRLIGAVAYGLAWGTTPVAGITPFEDMDDYLEAPASARKVDVAGADARAIAAESGVTVAQAEQGFKHLPVPFGMSGVTDGRLTQKFDRKLPYLQKGAYRMGASSSDAAAPVESIVAGGNLAAVESVGDVTSAGIGTVTSICEGKVVGFGHPMLFSGETSYGLGAADVIYVQEDPLGVPFKVANVGEVGGTITDDRLAGISGDLGDTPTAVPFDSTVTYRANSRTGHTDVLVEDALANIAFYGQLGNHDRVFDAVDGGSSDQDWLIKGTDENGDPFTIDSGDLFTSDYDISYEASWQLADILYALGQLEDVEVSSASAESNVTDETGVYNVRKVEQKVAGGWKKVTNERARVKAGTTLVLRATLANGTDTETVTYPIAIPKNLDGQRGFVSIEGGNWAWTNIYNVDSVADLIETLETEPQNNEVAAQIQIGRGGKKVRETMVSEPLGLVVNRSKYVEVVVGSGAKCRGC